MSSYDAPVMKLVRIADSVEFDIPADCVWPERVQSNAIVQEVDHTIGGSAVIWNGKKLGGIEFTLSSREGTWFTTEQASALVAEAENNRDGKYTILLPTGETKELCWRHIPAVSFEPVPLSETTDMQNAVYTGTLNFWE